MNFNINNFDLNNYDEIVYEYIKPHLGKKMIFDKPNNEFNKLNNEFNLLNFDFDSLNFDFGVLNFEDNFQKGGDFNKIKACVGKEFKNKNIPFSLYTKNHKYDFIINNNNDMFDQIINNKKNIEAYFLGEGSSNLVYDVSLLNNNFKNENYILKLMYDSDEYIKIVKKYNDDKIKINNICKNMKDSIYNTNIFNTKINNINKINNPLIEIYSHGITSFNGKKCQNIPVCFFITKKYNNDFNVLNFENKIFVFNEFVKLLKEFYKNSLVIYDIKTPNIGYDMITINNVKKPIIIIIDYDTGLFIDVDNYYKKNPLIPSDNALITHNIKPYHLGTYIPYHIYCKFDTNPNTPTSLNLTVNDMLFNSLGGLLEIFASFFIEKNNFDLYKYMVCFVRFENFQVLQNIITINKKLINLLLDTYKNCAYVFLTSINKILDINYINYYFINKIENLDYNYFDNLIITDEIINRLVNVYSSQKFEKWKKDEIEINVSITNEPNTNYFNDITYLMNHDYYFFIKKQIILCFNEKKCILTFKNDIFYFNMLKIITNLILDRHNSSILNKNLLFYHMFIQFCVNYNKYVNEIKNINNIKKKYLLKNNITKIFAEK